MYVFIKNICILSVFVAIMSVAARENNLVAKGRLGYFYLTSELLQKNYRHGGADYEIELQSRLHENVAAWLNVNIFRRDGKDIGFCDPLTLHVYPVSAGLIYPLTPDSVVSPYLGIGASYSFITVIQEANKKQEFHHQKWGCVGKSGLFVYCSEAAYVDLFADYYYTQPSKEGVSSSIGGLRIGLGFGFNY